MAKESWSALVQQVVTIDDCGTRHAVPVKACKVEHRDG